MMIDLTLFAVIKLVKQADSCARNNRNLRICIVLYGSVLCNS